jgi:hypothetical protein
MAVLVTYCEALLPLPPFDRWCDDVRRNAAAHLDDVEDSAEAPDVETPVTVATRELSHEGGAWRAHLRAFRDGSAWRGFIAFETGSASRVHRTALIFRESSPADVRERFQSFESSTLSAFLRSALP